MGYAIATSNLQPVRSLAVHPTHGRFEWGRSWSPLYIMLDMTFERTRIVDRPDG